MNGCKTDRGAWDGCAARYVSRRTSYVTSVATTGRSFPSVRGIIPPLSIPLLLALLCGGATESWAVVTDRGASGGDAARDVGRPTFYETSVATATAGRSFPSAQTGQSKAMITEPSRNSASVRANLLARAKSQEGPSPADPDHGEGPQTQKEAFGVPDSLTLELWSSRISAPDSSDDVETSLALKRLIRQVHRMTFNDKGRTPPSVPSAEPAPVTEPPAPPTATAETVQPAQAEAVANPTPETTTALSAKARKGLADLQRNPSRVRDPLEAAELLFLSGRPGDAAPFYEEALRRTSPGTGSPSQKSAMGGPVTASGSDRAWILFQLGNCLREADAAKAQDAYVKLISEYPDSPWTEMARASGRLLAWYQSTRPDQLVAPAR